MPKTYTISFFAIVLTILFGVLAALPNLASEPKAPLLSSELLLGTSLRPSLQITFTPVATVFLPIIQIPPLAPGVYLQANHSYYVNFGYLHIVGEVYNHTATPIKFVKVIVDIFGSGNTLLDTDYTYIELDNLPPESKGCYNLSLPQPSNWIYYQLSRTYSYPGEPLPKLTVFNQSASIEPDGSYRIIGQVRNDEAVRVEFVKPIFTLYRNGLVWDCDFTFVNITHLNPGEVSSFEETFSERDDYSDVTYQIQVDGNPQ